MSYRFMWDSSFSLTKICVFSAFLVEEPAWLQGWDSMVESECRACPPGRFSMQIPKGFEGDTAICRLEPQFLFVGTDVCSKKNFNHLTFRMLSYLSFTIFQLKQKSFTVSFWSSHLKPVLFCILWRCNIAFQKQRSAFLAVWGEPCLASHPKVCAVRVAFNRRSQQKRVSCVPRARLLQVMEQNAASNAHKAKEWQGIAKRWPSRGDVKEFRKQPHSKHVAVWKYYCNLRHCTWCLLNSFDDVIWFMADKFDSIVSK